MSAHGVLADAVGAALRGHAALGVAINGVFDTPPARAVRPYALIEEAVLADWSTKDLAGREGRLAVSLLDTGEGGERLRMLADEAIAAITALPRELGEGWRIASLAFVRSRIFREGPGMCAAVIEYRVRMLQAN
jgi:hypothetical protein